MGALFAVYPFAKKPRRWLIFWLVVSALTTGAMGATDEIGLFLTLRFVGGVANALGLALASSLVLDRLASIGRSSFAAIHSAGVGVDIAASATLVSAIALEGSGWREMWLMAGVASLAAALAPTILLPEPRDHLTPPPSGTTKFDSATWRFTIAYGLFGFGYVIIATFIVAIVRLDAHSSSVEYWVWLIVGLCATPSVAIWTHIGRCIGELRTFAVAASVEAAGVLLSVSVKGVIGLLLSGALLGATFMGLTALGMIAGRTLVGGSRRPLVFLSSALAVGQIIGPLFAGYGVELTGTFFWPCVIAAVALVIGALLALSVRAGRS